MVDKDSADKGFTIEGGNGNKMTGGLGDDNITGSGINTINYIIGDGNDIIN